MKSSIYEYKDYKKYLVDLIENDESGGRGKRKDLAMAINSQVSHITNVLSGNGHLNPEQAEATARFFGLNLAETEFLFNLIQYNRAGTESLRNFYEKILSDRVEKYSTLKNRLKMPDSLKAQEEARYYSSWQYGAVHVMLTIPQFQTREALSKKLDIPIQRTNEILNFLVETGLCAKEGQRYVVLRPQLHLDKSSPLVAKHQTNWRLRSILSMDHNNPEDLHYSASFTLSEKDYPRVREILTKALSEAFKIIVPSPEEQGAVITLDLFKL